MRTKSTGAGLSLLISIILHLTIIASLPSPSIRKKVTPVGHVQFSVIERRVEQAAIPLQSKSGFLQQGISSGSGDQKSSGTSRPSSRGKARIASRSLAGSVDVVTSRVIPMVETSGSGDGVEKGDLEGGMVATANSGGGTNHEQSHKDGLPIEMQRNGYALMVRRTLQQAGQYPVIAKRYRLQGRVVVGIRIDHSGRVESVRLQESSNHRILDETVLSMARELHSLPPPPGGPIEVTIPVIFTLH